MVELVYFELRDSVDKLTGGDFDCHLCLAQFGSFNDIQKHYLTEHTNVIIAIKDGSGKCKIRRRFVGPRSRRPNFWQSLVHDDEAEETHEEVVNFFRQKKAQWPPVQNVAVENTQPEIVTKEIQDFCLDEETEPWPSMTELLAEGYNDVVAAALDLDDLTSVDDIMSELTCYSPLLKDTSTDDEVLLQTISPLRIHDPSPEQIQNSIPGNENVIDTQSSLDAEIGWPNLSIPGVEKGPLELQTSIVGDITEADSDEVKLTKASSTCLEAETTAIPDIEWCDVLSFLSDVGAQEGSDSQLDLGALVVPVIQEQEQSMDQNVTELTCDPPLIEVTDVDANSTIEVDPSVNADLQNIISEMITDITTAEESSMNSVSENKENVAEAQAVAKSPMTVSKRLNSPASASGDRDQAFRKRKWGSSNSCSNINGICENGGGSSQKKLCCWMTPTTSMTNRNEGKVKRTKSPPLSTSPHLIRRRSLRYLTKSQQL